MRGGRRSSGPTSDGRNSSLRGSETSPVLVFPEIGPLTKSAACECRRVGAGAGSVQRRRLGRRRGA